MLDRFHEVSKHYENKLSILNETDDDTKAIMILIMLDSLAQNYKGYPRGGSESKQAFLDFVIDFSGNEWGFWKAVDPITLYYRLTSSDDIPLSESPVLRCVEQSNVYFPLSDGFEENAEELLGLIEDEKRRKTLMKEHQYVSLLYRLRSKLVHELNMPSVLFSRTEVESYGRKPYYYNSGGGLDNTSYDVELAKRRTTWHLVFPPEFLELVFRECLCNYLMDCEEKEIDPFFSNNEDRSSYLAWYDIREKNN